MGIFGDPGDTLKLDNAAVLSVLSCWEKKYDLILLNGDIIESLKSEKLFFSHYEQTLKVLEDRQPIIQRILNNSKYVWLVGNHDYPLETILKLPVHIKLSLADGYTLIAQHGHLLRADKTFYSDFERRYYLMYWLIWYIDKFRATKYPDDSVEFIIEQYLKEYRQQTLTPQKGHTLIKYLLRVAFFIVDRNADHPAHNFSIFLWKRAQKLFRQEKTIVFFGHTHLSEINYAEHQNFYINTGRFCSRSRYSKMVFDTTNGKITILETSTGSS